MCCGVCVALHSIAKKNFLRAVFACGLMCLIIYWKFMRHTPSAPLCIGIIMDGNRRWAKGQGLPVSAGHTAGFEKLKEVLNWCEASQVTHLVVYAFSTENMQRAEEETTKIFSLFIQGLEVFFNNTKNATCALHIIGTTEGLSQPLIDAIAKVEMKNPKHPKYHLWVCFNYGGRAELVAGMRALSTLGVPIDEHTLKRALWSKDMPDPDLIIRTGGERRLSGFLTWGSVYSELFFSDSFWPAFSKEEFFSILETYKNRERRFGR